jgi:hypothetical protein
MPTAQRHGAHRAVSSGLLIELVSFDEPLDCQTPSALVLKWLSAWHWPRSDRRSSPMRTDGSSHSRRRDSAGWPVPASTGAAAAGWLPPASPRDWAARSRRCASGGSDWERTTARPGGQDLSLDLGEEQCGSVMIGHAGIILAPHSIRNLLAGCCTGHSRLA